MADTTGEGDEPLAEAFRCQQESQHLEPRQHAHHFHVALGCLINVVPHTDPRIPIERIRALDRRLRTPKKTEPLIGPRSHAPFRRQGRNVGSSTARWRRSGPCRRVRRRSCRCSRGFRIHETASRPRSSREYICGEHGSVLHIASRVSVPHCRARKSPERPLNFDCGLPPSLRRAEPAPFAGPESGTGLPTVKPGPRQRVRQPGVS